MSKVNSIIVLVQLVLFGFTCNCQTYIPYIEENKYWFYNTHSGADANPGSLSEYVHFFKGDTIITQTQYKRLFKASLKGQHLCQFPPCFTPNIPYDVNSPFEIGYAREDMTSKRVFYLPKYESDESCANSEYELYNFGLLVGENISDCHRQKIFPQDVNRIGKVDSIKTEFIYGRDRNVHYFTGLYTIGLPFFFPMKLIEGVGFDYYDPINYTPNTFYASFCEGSLEQCNFLNSTVNINIQATFSVIPNPCTERLVINTENTIKRVHILNQMGSVVAVSNQHEINLDYFPSGLYFAKVLFQNGTMGIQKFVKN